MVALRNFNNEKYISSTFLKKRGINKKSLDNCFSKFNTGKSLNFQFIKDINSNEKWVLYSSIPFKKLSQLGLPTDTKLLENVVNHDEMKNQNSNLSEISFILNNAWINPLFWKKNLSYYQDYNIDLDKKELFAKTHAVISEVIELKKNKRYKLKEIHQMYLNFENILFWTKSYQYFSKKIKKSEDKGIEQTIVHGFLRWGRNNYKVTTLAKNRIIFYYSNPKRYSRSVITEKVNEELLSKGKPTISLSSVKNIIKNEGFKNRADIVRFGRKYTEDNIIPYLRRSEPRHIAELYQIDSTRLNIQFIDDEGKFDHLYLCVMMDVFTRKIIGYSVSKTENVVMIMECIKTAFESFGYIPIQIVHDNHRSYTSKEFRKLKMVLDEYGVYTRAARRGNAKDKAHVERWFRIFGNDYLNRVIGNLGEGIRTKTEGGRTQRELEDYFKKKSNIRNKKKLVQLVFSLIKEYNRKTEMEKKSITSSKVKMMKFQPFDIAKMFYKSKKKKVNRSMIHMQMKHENYTYTIKDHDLANEINGSFVEVRYDEEFPDTIYLFNLKTNKRYGSLKSDIRVNIVPNEKELRKIEKHNSLLRTRVQKAFNELVTEIDNGKLELDSLPTFQTLNNKEHLNRILSQSEDQLLIGDMINEYKVTRKTRKANKEVDMGRFFTDRYLKKSKSRRIITLED